MSNLRAIRRVFIAKPVTNGADTTQIPASTNRLYDFTTDSLNIGEGFLGGYEPVAGSGNPSAVTATSLSAGEFLEFIQRNSITGQLPPLPVRTIEKSGQIDPRSRCGVRIHFEAAREGANEIHMLEASLGVNTAATVPSRIAFQPQDNFYYQYTTRVTGAIPDLYNGTAASSSGKVVDYQSPDFTFAGYSDQSARDLILANLTWKHNTANNPSARTTVAINLTQTNPGHTGAVTVANIIAAGVGTRVLIGFNVDGVADYLTISRDILNSLTAIAANTVVNDAGAAVAISTLYVIPYLLPTTSVIPTTPANLHVAGSGVAATTIRAQFTMFICLDWTKVYYREREDFKTGLYLGLELDFQNIGASNTRLTVATEAIGSTNRVRMDYREEQFRRYNEDAGRPYEAMHIEYPSELVPGAWYDSFLIEWCVTNYGNHGLNSDNRKSITIHVPNYSLGGSTAVNPLYNTGGTTTNPLRTYLVGLLNDFNTENRLGNPTIV